MNIFKISTFFILFLFILSSCSSNKNSILELQDHSNRVSLSLGMSQKEVEKQVPLLSVGFKENDFCDSSYGENFEDRIDVQYLRLRILYRSNCNIV